MKSALLFVKESDGENPLNPRFFKEIIGKRKVIG